MSLVAHSCWHSSSTVSSWSLQLGSTTLFQWSSVKNPTVCALQSLALRQKNSYRAPTRSRVACKSCLKEDSISIDFPRVWWAGQLNRISLPSLALKVKRKNLEDTRDLLWGAPSRIFFDRHSSLATNRKLLTSTTL